MANSAAEFDDRRKDRIPGLPDKPDVAILKRYQPYRRGIGPQVIRHLRRFSDRDKHREVTVTNIAPQGIQVHVQVGKGLALGTFTHLIDGPVALKPGTKIAKVEVFRHPKAHGEVRVDANFETTPMVGGRVAAGGLIAGASQIVREILDQFEALY